jgi:hypothetical protein
VREGKGREGGARAWKELGLGRGPCGKKGERGKGPKEKRREERGGKSWAGTKRRFGLPSFIPSPFLFFFYTLTIQTNLVEFQ